MTRAPAKSRSCSRSDGRCTSSWTHTASERSRAYRSRAGWSSTQSPRRSGSPRGSVRCLAAIAASVDQARAKSFERRMTTSDAAGAAIRGAARLSLVQPESLVGVQPGCNPRAEPINVLRVWLAVRAAAELGQPQLTGVYCAVELHPLSVYTRSELQPLPQVRGVGVAGVHHVQRACWVIGERSAAFWTASSPTSDSITKW